MSPEEDFKGRVVAVLHRISGGLGGGRGGVQLSIFFVVACVCMSQTVKSWERLSIMFFWHFVKEKNKVWSGRPSCLSVLVSYSRGG